MKFLRYLFISLITVVSSCLITTKMVHAQDTGWIIEDFSADIKLNQDTTVDVAETIQVDFGSLQKHGIYRLIPVKYPDKYGNNLDIRFQLIGVSDQNSVPRKVAQTSEGKNIKLKIGDANAVVSGQQTYIIRYQVSRIITQPTDQAEFYWNVTGTGWPVPIAHTSATITTPPNSLTNSICFTGYTGESSTKCSSKQNGQTVIIETTKSLFPSQGLTAAVALQKGAFHFPGIVKQIIWFFRDNLLYLLPLCILLFMLRAYWTKGRDKQYHHLFHHDEGVETLPLFEKLAIPNVYGPPKDLSPGEVGTLIDEKVHLQDITSVVIDLARRGYFTITDIPKKGLFGQADYELKIKDKDETDLKDYETEVMSMLFGVDRDETVKVSKPHSSAYLHLDKAQKKLYEYLAGSGYFSGNPQSIRNSYLVGAFLVGIISVSFISPILLGLGFGASSFVAPLLSAGIIAIFAPFMPARTAKGREALREVAGLREWIRLGAWREQIHEKHNFFEEVLPYAIAFGLTAKFIQAFKDADIKNLSWYHSSESLSGARLHYFANHFGSSLGSSVGSTRPHTSASSGGSGFSGGSSGGGFGGGGGGSW